MTTPDNGLLALNGISLLELFDYDEKPTFIFDIEKQADTTDWSVKVVYHNHSIRSSHGTLAVLLGLIRNGPAPLANELKDRSLFEQWITGKQAAREASSQYSRQYLFHDLLWTRTTLRKRWVVAAGLSVDPVEIFPLVTPWSLPGPPTSTATARVPTISIESFYEDDIPHTAAADHPESNSEITHPSRSKSPPLAQREPLCEQPSDLGTERMVTAEYMRSRWPQPNPDYNVKSLDALNTTPEPPSFWDETLRDLQKNRQDVPLAVAYALGDCEDSNLDHKSRTVSFKAAVGIPNSHALLLKEAAIDQSERGLMRTFREAIEFENPRLLRIDGTSLPRKVLQRDDTGRAWTDVVVTRLASGNQIFGFLLIGLNPRRVQDDAYKRFALLLSKQLSTSLTTLVLLNKARSTEAALSEMVTKQSREAADVEQRFEALAELSPVGMYYLSIMGEVIYANDSYFEMTGHPRGLFKEMSFSNLYLDEDQEVIKQEWHKLTVLKMKRSFELRLKKKWYHEATGEWKVVCVLASAVAQLNDDGTVKSIIGTLADISAQKQAEEDALERARLLEKLAIKMQQASEFEVKFRRMAEISPIGMYETAITGELMWANSTWYIMTGHGTEPEDHYAKSFYKFIDPADHGLMDREWSRLINEKQEIRFDFRTVKPWINYASGKPVAEPCWMLAMAVPEFDVDGSVKHIFGTLTEISQLKWSEAQEKRNRMEADEARKSQERFMDITSHEMRNPLSAIIQSADGIAASLAEFNISSKDPLLFQEIADSNYESAQIIALCAQHQGRIINDVLTLSKLDSGMLVVDPIPVQPVSMIKQTLKMFEGELSAHSMTLKLVEDESLHRHKIDWVLIDPSRINQIFINLLTNAIKFTKHSINRNVTVTIHMSINKPLNDELGPIEWFPSRAGSPKSDQTRKRNWVQEEHLYLACTVQDTGKGLSSEEKTRLFHRFSQADPRTHTLYGGSGLGLFISRELTELHGGGIGVASEVGEGSTFAFYIKTTRAAALDQDGRQQMKSRHTSRRSSIKSRNIDSPALLQKFAMDDVFMDPKKSSKDDSNTSPLFEILLVEDNLVNQKVLKRQLQKAGCVVNVANHGMEALTFLRTTALWADNKGSGKKLDIVLMDVEMPVMGGLACVGRIRQMQEEGQLTRHVPVIAVTANARQAQIESCMAARMDDFVGKPFRVPELIAKMEKVLADLCILPETEKLN